MTRERASRRRFLQLGVATAAAGVAGCITGEDGGDDGQTTTETATGTPQSDSWPTFAADAANSGSVSDGDGPTDGVEARWTADIGDAARPTGSESNPAVVDDTVYVGAGQQVNALDAGSGAQAWEAAVPGGSGMSHPAVADGVVYCGSGVVSDRMIHAYDAATGEAVWHATAGDPVYGSPAVDGDSVYVGSLDHTVYALDAADGTERWSFETAEKVYADPALVGDTVYVGSYDDTVYALDAASGEMRWAYDTGSVVDGGAAVVDGTVYVGSANGSVYALEEP
jgi:outer membrane protein assembly factor BamB